MVNLKNYFFFGGGGIDTKDFAKQGGCSKGVYYGGGHMMMTVRGGG